MEETIFVSSVISYLCVMKSLPPKGFAISGIHHPKGQVFNIWASMGTLYIRAIAVFKKSY